MDNQRLFLWVTLGFVLWLNYQAWHSDYAPVPDPVADVVDVADEYVLRTVDGQALPFKFAIFAEPPLVPVGNPAGDLGVEIASGRLILALDGTYTDELIQTAAAGSETPLTSSGTYVLNDNYVTFTSDQDVASLLGGDFTGTIEGDTLAAQRSGYVLVYYR